MLFFYWWIVGNILPLHRTISISMFISTNNLKELPQADVILPSLELDSATFVRGDIFNMNNVIWNKINGWGDKYEASTDGRVKTRTAFNTLGKRVKGHPKIFPEKINRTGYPVVVLSANGAVKEKLVHRLIAETFIPNPQNLECVNHKNGIKTDNRVDNLEWCSKSDNTKKAHQTGLIKKQTWETNPFAFLTANQVLDIVKSKKSHKELAAEYDVTYTAIWAIRNGDSWSEITGITRVKKRCLLNKELVLYVFNSTKSIYSLEKELKIGYTMLRNIRKGITYKHITQNESSR